MASPRRSPYLPDGSGMFVAKTRHVDLFHKNMPVRRKMTGVVLAFVVAGMTAAVARAELTGADNPAESGIGKEFGGKREEVVPGAPDGVTDNTVAIQRAVDAMSAAGGGRLGLLGA